MKESPLPRFNHVEETLQRQWGQEFLLEVSSGYYTFKKLVMLKGTKGGLQYHRKKDETAFVVSGKLLVRYVHNSEIKERFVEEGETLRFPCGCIHQEEAVEDTVIIEASTPFMNDRVRMEGHFGMEVNGLPTTDIDEIVEL